MCQELISQSLETISRLLPRPIHGWCTRAHPDQQVSISATSVYKTPLLDAGDSGNWDLEQTLSEIARLRITAPTSMNSTSSRAHLLTYFRHCGLDVTFLDLCESETQNLVPTRGLLITIYHNGERWSVRQQN